MHKLVKTSTLGAAIITAMLPLVCCWGPTLLAGVAVLSGAATKMAWLHPYEPWFYSVSFITLGYSHYSAYKVDPKESNSCQSCSVDENSTVISKDKYTKITLWVATALVLIMYLVNTFAEIII